MFVGFDVIIHTRIATASRRAIHTDDDCVEPPKHPRNSLIPNTWDVVLGKTVQSNLAYLANSNRDAQLGPQDEKWTGYDGSNKLTLVELVNDKCA